MTKSLYRVSLSIHIYIYYARLTITEINVRRSRFLYTFYFSLPIRNRLLNHDKVSDAKST